MATLSSEKKGRKGFPSIKQGNLNKDAWPMSKPSPKNDQTPQQFEWNYRTFKS